MRRVILQSKIMWRVREGEECIRYFIGSLTGERNLQIMEMTNIREAKWERFEEEEIYKKLEGNLQKINRNDKIELERVINLIGRIEEITDEELWKMSLRLQYDDTRPYMRLSAVS